MTDAVVNVARQATKRGWGRSTWNSGAWNRNVLTPDISMTGAVGSTFVSAEANVTGLSGAVGVKFLGDEDVITNNNLTVSGFSADANLGTATTKIVTNQDVTGNSADGSLGNVTVIGNAKINVSQVSATTNTGTLLMWGEINTNQTLIGKKLKKRHRR